jgi:hypothetical protein
MSTSTLKMRLKQNPCSNNISDQHPAVRGGSAQATATTRQLRAAEP